MTSHDTGSTLKWFHSGIYKEFCKISTTNNMCRKIYIQQPLMTEHLYNVDELFNEAWWLMLS